jgi:hypothetical protein
MYCNAYTSAFCNSVVVTSTLSDEQSLEFFESLDGFITEMKAADEKKLDRLSIDFTKNSIDDIIASLIGYSQQHFKKIQYAPDNDNVETFVKALPHNQKLDFYHRHFLGLINRISQYHQSR